VTSRCSEDTRQGHGSRCISLRRGGKIRARLVPVGTKAAVAIVVLTALGCSSGSVAPVRPSRPDLVFPLDASLTTPGGIWAIVAMGHLHQPLNTFWQLFHLAAGTARWTLATPPSVASTGGMYATTAGPAGDSLLVGFGPSNLLRFSPLAESANGGSSWSTGFLPSGLAPRASSLAAASDGRLIALLSADQGEVVTGSVGLSSWAAQVTGGQLATATGGRSCLVKEVTAVGFTASGQELLGAACGRPGVAGILAERDGGWLIVGPQVPSVLRDEAVTVVGFEHLGDLTTAVLAGEGSDGLTIVASSTTNGNHWSSSPSLHLGSSFLTSSGPAMGHSLFVLSESRAGQENLEVTHGPAGSWIQDGDVPAGTSTVAFGPGRVDALAAHDSTLTDWRLQSGTWHEAQVIDVPIQYGSSA